MAKDILSRKPAVPQRDGTSPSPKRSTSTTGGVGWKIVVCLAFFVLGGICGVALYKYREGQLQLSSNTAFIKDQLAVASGLGEQHKCKEAIVVLDEVLDLYKDKELELPKNVGETAYKIAAQAAEIKDVESIGALVQRFDTSNELKDLYENVLTTVAKEIANGKVELEFRGSQWLSFETGNCSEIPVAAMRKLDICLREVTAEVDKASKATEPFKPEIIGWPAISDWRKTHRPSAQFDVLFHVAGRERIIIGDLTFLGESTMQEALRSSLRARSYKPGIGNSLPEDVWVRHVAPRWSLSDDFVSGFGEVFAGAAYVIRCSDGRSLALVRFDAVEPTEAGDSLVQLSYVYPIEAPVRRNPSVGEHSQLSFDTVDMMLSVARRIRKGWENYPK